MGLRWYDVDLFTENPTIHVRHSLSRQINLDGGDKKTERKLRDTKTNGSKRNIPIMPQLLDDFKKYRESQIHLKKQNNITREETDFVFENSVFKEHEPRRFYDKYNIWKSSKMPIFKRLTFILSGIHLQLEQ